jgi:peptidoglycan hydrolase-like protein with peptidoglycan-binding domain
VQRALGDGHDLTSPRFAGEPILEQCFDDEARLTIGAHGPAVVKIQQALLDSGYDLGPKGADGHYGQRTWNAIKQFKANEHLGWEHMGDVGPGTMTRLNERFPAQSPIAPPTAVEGDESACPAFDDVITAVAAEPELADAMISVHLTSASSFASPVSSTAASTTAVSTVGASAGGIPAAIDRFKKLANAKDPATGNDEPVNISTWGQFFWTGQLNEAIGSETARLRGSDPDAVKFANQADAARTAILNRDKTVGKQLAELDKLAASTTSREKAAMQALLKAPSGAGGAVDAKLWAAFNASPDSSIPKTLLNSNRSLRVMRAVLGYNSGACGFHAARVAARLKAKGGIVKPSGKAPPSCPAMTKGSAIRDRRPMGKPTSAFGPAATAAVDPSSTHMLGDVILGSNALAAVALIQQALDNGYQVHARVMSGVGYGSTGVLNPKSVPAPLSTPPPEEHSLLIFGYDGSTFVFHDPDAGVSHTPEGGFGKLHYDFTDDRLSTAENPGDMPVNADGKHRRGDKRYQIITLSVF